MLEGSNRAMFRKLAFMFGNATQDADQQLLAREDQWIVKNGEDKYYLPANRCHFLLSFFWTTTTERRMEWHMTMSTDSVHVGILTSQGYSRSGPPRLVINIHLGLVSKDVSVGENKMMARIFLSQFIKAESNYLTTDFKTPGWVTPSRSGRAI